MSECMCTDMRACPRCSEEYNSVAEMNQKKRRRIAELERENARLREALEEIASFDRDADGLSEYMNEIAVKALGGGE